MMLILDSIAEQNDWRLLEDKVFGDKARMQIQYYDISDYNGFHSCFLLKGNS